MTDDVASRHLQELAQRLPVFGLFDLIEAITLAPDVRTAVMRETARVVELAVAQDLDGPPALACARLLATSEGSQIPERFTAWRATLEAASPDRVGMSLTLNHFGSWLTTAPGAEVALLGSLPRIAPVLGELKAAGVATLLTLAANAGDPIALLNAAGAYGSTDGATVLAVLRIGAMAEGWEDPTVLVRLAKAIPPESTEDSRDAERVIAAMAGFVDACGSSDASRTGMALMLTLAEHNVSSAYATATDGRKVLKRLPSDTALPWLEDFALLARTVGVRVVGFALGTLPGLYARHGATQTRSFVQRTASLAEAYGTTAAQWFYEQKTTAAKGALGG